jgi:hypothetical protein
MSKFTGEYSRLYQTEQDCQCDNDHDECFLNSIMVNKNILIIQISILFSFKYTVPPNSGSKDILKRARRVRRVCF